MSCVDKFVDQIINADNDYQEMDRVYLYNRICALVGDDNHLDGNDTKEALIQTAVQNKKLRTVKLLKKFSMIN
jgi:hypothetical protein